MSYEQRRIALKNKAMAVVRHDRAEQAVHVAEHNLKTAISARMLIPHMSALFGALDDARERLTRAKIAQVWHGGTLT